MSLSPTPTILSANNKYRWLVFLIFGTMLLVGWVFMQFTELYIDDLEMLSQKSPEEAVNKSALLLVFISMGAGFPAVGIGAYFTYQGNLIRIAQQFPLPGVRVIVDTPIIVGSSATLRGYLLMAGGAMLVIVGLILPLIAWWFIESF